MNRTFPVVKRILPCIMFVVAALTTALSAPEWGRLALMDVGKRFTAATSVLDVEKDWRSYSPINLFDGDTGTCWAVGNGGIGEKVYLLADKGFGSVTIVNGLAKTRRLFLANNRVRTLRAVMLAGVTWKDRVTEIGPVFDILPFDEGRTISLEDHALPQKIRFPFDWKAFSQFSEKAMERFREREKEQGRAVPATLEVRPILSLEIRTIYPGRVYNDTCISEITIAP